MLWKIHEICIVMDLFYVDFDIWREDVMNLFDNLQLDTRDMYFYINQQVIIRRIFKEIHMVKVRFANKPIEFIVDINAITKNPTTEVSISIGLLEGDIK